MPFMVVMGEPRVKLPVAPDDLALTARRFFLGGAVLSCGLGFAPGMSAASLLSVSSTHRRRSGMPISAYLAWGRGGISFTGPSCHRWSILSRPPTTTESTKPLLRSSSSTFFRVCGPCSMTDPGDTGARPGSWPHRWPRGPHRCPARARIG